MRTRELKNNNEDLMVTKRDGRDFFDELYSQKKKKRKHQQQEEFTSLVMWDKHKKRNILKDTERAGCLVLNVHEEELK